MAYQNLIFNQTKTNKEAIRRHVSKLNATIEPKGLILDRLFEEKIIGNYDKYAIEQLPSREDRARRLMHWLFETSNPNALSVFNRVLHEISEYDWLTCSIDLEAVKHEAAIEHHLYGDIIYPPSSSSTFKNFMSTDHIGMIDKKIQTIEFLIRDEIVLLCLRESIYKKLKCGILRHRICTLKFLSEITSIQSLADDIMEQLDDLYMLGRLLGASWNDCETKAAKFHCVNKITRSIASHGIRVTESVQGTVTALVDEVTSEAIADAKADCNSIRYSRNQGVDHNSDTCRSEGTVRLYGVSMEQEHLRAQLVSNRKLFSKNLQTLEFWINETSLSSLVSFDVFKLKYWKSLMDELLQSRSTIIIDLVRKQLEEVYTLCRCLGAAWSDYESSEAEFSFVHDIIQSIDDAGSPITESMQESMRALVKEVMSKAIADAKADWNLTESPGKGQAEETSGMKRKSNVEKGDKIKRKRSPCATNGYCTD